MYKRICAFAFLAAAFFTLTNCAAVSVENIRKSAASSPASAAYIEGVPFYPQNEYLCGPAAIASVTDYWLKTPAGMEGAAKAVYGERWKGTLPIDLVLYAKEKGFDAEFYKGGLADLKSKIRAKAPPILFIDAGWGIIRSGHYMVATGYSDESESVTAHSGMDKDAVFSYAELARAWQKTSYSTILLTPKGEISPKATK